MFGRVCVLSGVSRTVFFERGLSGTDTLEVSREPCAGAHGGLNTLVKYGVTVAIWRLSSGAPGLRGSRRRSSVGLRDVEACRGLSNRLEYAIMH